MSLISFIHLGEPPSKRRIRRNHGHEHSCGDLKIHRSRRAKKPSPSTARLAREDANPTASLKMGANSARGGGSRSVVENSKHLSFGLTRSRSAVKIGQYARIVAVCERCACTTVNPHLQHRANVRLPHAACKIQAPISHSCSPWFRHTFQACLHPTTRSTPTLSPTRH